MMKSNNYKLYKMMGKPLIKIKNAEINDLRKEAFIENCTFIISGIGSVCLNLGAHNLKEEFGYFKIPMLICGGLLGGTCAAGLFYINRTDSANERRKQIKQLKLERKEIKQNFIALGTDSIKKR